MMRPSRSTRATTQTQSTAPSNTGSQAGTYPDVPSILLTSAAPTAPAAALDSPAFFSQSLEDSWQSMSSQLPVPLAPKSDNSTRKKLVPKKSKLSILGLGKDKDKGKDLSDVVRRIGASNTASTRAGFEIYVDPTDDPEMGEIMMVKKKKSRVALDGMSWGALGEVTNVPKVTPPVPSMKDKENDLLKVKTDEEKKWWSIGRGRKDSKDKNKENKASISTQPVEFIHKPEPRSKTPEPFKSSKESRGRFNSLDSGLLFGKAKNASVRSTEAPRASTPAVQISEPEQDAEPPSVRERARSTTPMFGRSMTPTFGGLLAPRATSTTPTEEKQGSIAVRAMKSMRSLARMSSWSQLKNMPPPTAQELAEEMARAEEDDVEREKPKKEKKVKSKKAGSVKEKKKKEKIDENGNPVKKKKSTKQEKEKSQTLRLSTSSFEVGHLSEVPKDLGTKKRSILGLGLPASIRLPKRRVGSTASSINSITGQQPPTWDHLPVIPNVAIPTVAPAQANRLSVESALPQGRDRSASVASSNGSSLRPISIASSRLSSGSSVVSGVSAGGSSGASIRWDEDCLETVREQRRKEREARRISEDSEAAPIRKNSRESTRRSADARKRMPLSGVFEEVHHHQVGVAMMKDLTEVTEEESKVEEIETLYLPNVKRLSAGSAKSERTTSTRSSIRRRRPILMIEEATADGHDFVDEELGDDDSGRDEDDGAETPVKKPRARPLSEPLLGKARPKPMHEDEDGIHSILSAATQDLALLLNTLDLQATPGTPDMTPFKPTPASTVEMDASASVSATLSSHDGSPQSKSTKARVALGVDSPLKKTLRGEVSSIASLRPYAQSRKNSTSGPLASSTATLKPKASTIGKTQAELISQHITPWSVLMQNVSPAKSKASSKIASPASTISKATPPVFKLGHKRTMTPAPEPEPEPVFQPLKPRSRAPTVTSTDFNGMATIRPVKSKVQLAIDIFNKGPEEPEKIDPSLFSARTFGPQSATLSKGSKCSMMLDDLSTSNNPTPVFKRVQEIEQHQRLSPYSVDNRSSQLSCDSYLYAHRAPIGRETRKVLGMSGTLGGSDVSLFDGPDPDAEDPYSDVPEELRYLLATHSKRSSIAESVAFHDEPSRTRPISAPPSMPPPPVPTEAPELELPTFRAMVFDDDQQLDVDCFSTFSDEDTKKSFDFTGEIRKLNEAGASDTASFVEQLEKAFRTPAKVDLRYDFASYLQVEVPPVPALPMEFRMALGRSDSKVEASPMLVSPAKSESRLVDVKQPNMEKSLAEEAKSKSVIDMSSASRILDTLELSDSEAGSEDEDVVMGGEEHQDSAIGLGRSPNSNMSDGELNRSFRFGGIPTFGGSPCLSENDSSREITLSDIIPPPAQARALAEMSMMSEDLEDDSVLRSIYAKLLGSSAPGPHDIIPPTMSSESDKRQSIYRESSRPASTISFTGLDSFDEVRRGFEFSGDRSFYPPPAQPRNGRRAPHLRDDSVLSIASVSSYGHVLNNGVADPFDYSLPGHGERPVSEAISALSMSMTVEDTFEFRHNQPRRRVDSDASSFYFQARPTSIKPYGQLHRDSHRDSIMSVSSLAPPVSIFNRSYNRLSDSFGSVNSVSVPNTRYNGGLNSRIHHQRDMSVDSMASDFSPRRFDRPGLGEKMFNNPANRDSIISTMSSLYESGVSQSQFANRTSYDSIMDENPRSMPEDSIFDKTGHRNSVMSEFVFGDDGSRSYQAGLLPPHQFRPLSVYSDISVHSPPRADDTMISMLGGGHVRRQSVGSMIATSPCVRVGKRKHSAVQQDAKTYKNIEQYESPNKARIVEKPSIASTFQFGGEKLIKARHGLLERQSLDEHCLVADGEDTSGYGMPVFSRPTGAGRSRSSTCTSSSGGDTPPLSNSDGSSASGGSQSSIDISQLNLALSNVSHPTANLPRNRVRARARGSGHRRRYSKANMSRASIYETIEEEAPSPYSNKDDSSNPQGVYIVESDTSSITTAGEDTIYDEERGIVALRKFYALRDEVETTVSESRKIWMDTPFSLNTIQSFQPPHHPAGMQALLEHSVQNYGPLPSELRVHRVRSRTSSRASPYPASRIVKASVSPEPVKPLPLETQAPTVALRQVKLDHNVTALPPLKVSKSNTFAIKNTDNKLDKPTFIRPRVASNDRRTALGWSKRSTGAKSSTGQKENALPGKENYAVNSTATPSDTLRLNRPRPKGRALAGRTPASQHRVIRV